MDKYKDGGKLLPKKSKQKLSLTLKALQELIAHQCSNLKATITLSIW
ncbi:41890_t:CDS:1, partial [Gigaspora margarita]